MSSFMSMDRFWERKSLLDLSAQEWESLCDGCGKCCLNKLEDEDTGEVLYTRVACRYLDLDSCQCKAYSTRQKLVSECVSLVPDLVDEFHWLPASCAYRLLAEGNRLPAWHPLITKDKNSVHEAGVSVRGRAISEEYVHPDDMEEYVVRWIE